MMAAVAALRTATVVVCWCSTAHAFRPFDGTDASVADTGDIEVELGPVEYQREGPQRVLFAPDLRVNYGFALDWEATIEGDFTHPLSPGIPATTLVGISRSISRCAARASTTTPWVKYALA